MDDYPSTLNHSLWILVARNHVVVVSEFFMADRADASLFSDLSIQQPSHFGRRSEFSISTRTMQVFNPLNSESDRWLFNWRTSSEGFSRRHSSRRLKR
jgi:hypothetical protein